MSLTQEQIKNLLVQRKATGENEILYRVQLTGNHMPGMLEVVVDGIARFFGSTDDMHLPPKPPKYDPNRLFREGDKVRIKREINGRLLHHSFVNFKYDTVYTVDADEVQKDFKSGHVVITDGKHYCSLSFYELELVTPVEELEPYYTLQDCEEIDGDTVVFWAVRDEHDDTVAKFYVELYRADGAQKAAEAERDRRNAEYRKEMGK